MKLIIDIDEHTYTFAKCYGFLSAEDEDTLDDVAKALANGTPIPDNATNGEVLIMMFPPSEYMNDEWWNAPYQKGGKE